jgi:hypothetical protein
MIVSPLGILDRRRECLRALVEVTPQRSRQGRALSALASTGEARAQALTARTAWHTPQGTGTLPSSFGWRVPPSASKIGMGCLVTRAPLQVPGIKCDRGIKLPAFGHFSIGLLPRTRVPSREALSLRIADRFASRKSGVNTQKCARCFGLYCEYPTSLGEMHRAPVTSRGRRIHLEPHTAAP